MSARKAAQPESSSPDPKGSAPLKPRPKLFWALLIFFVIWIGALLALYFKTVYPHRHPSAATRPGASALPNAPR
jgi:hypothetical protein